jgi:hypothetical protein
MYNNRTTMATILLAGQEEQLTPRANSFGTAQGPHQVPPYRPEWTDTLAPTPTRTGRHQDHNSVRSRTLSVKWDGYEPYEVAHSEMAYPELTRKQAKERYGKIMADRAARIPALEKLLQTNDITPQRDDASIQGAHDWMSVNIERDPNNGRALASMWRAFCFDFALFLGEVMIERNPTLKWDMPTTGGKKAEGYQKHVITGSPKAHPEYYVNFHRRVETAAFRALAGDTEMPDLLVRTFKMEQEHV